MLSISRNFRFLLRLNNILEHDIRTICRNLYKSSRKNTPTSLNHKFINDVQPDVKSKDENDEFTRNEKIQRLSEILECTFHEASELLDKYKFLTRSKLATIEFKVNSLEEGGVSKDELINDLWILTYTPVKLQGRLELVKKLNLKPIKPWLLRCDESVLRSLSRTRENNRLAMGSCKNVTDYLKARLEMNESQIWVFAMKHPAVMRVQVSKIKEILDYLFSQGFSPLQVYHTPRILCHSITTIEERLALLRLKCYEPYSLSVLVKSNRMFKQFIKNIQLKRED